MQLTRAQRRKLAKAARELASEYADGRGPNLLPYSYCGCVLGQTFARAGVPNGDGLAAAQLEMAVNAHGMLSAATCRQVVGEYLPGRARRLIPGAVVFPLLWLADELEAQR